MTHLTITLPDAAKAYIDRQISSGTYNSADEFLTALIEQDRERQAKQKVNAMLRSALQKNKAIETTDEWWEEQRQYLTEKIPPQI